MSNDTAQINAETGYKQELKRALSVRDMAIFGMIYMIPTAPFAIYGFLAQTSLGMVSLVYVFGMVAMLFTVLSYKDMSEEFPIAGSVYSYATRGVHPTVGFFSGWALLLDYILIPSFCYVTAGVAMHAIIPAVPSWVWIILCILINTVINYCGIEFTALANRIMLGIEVLVLVIFLVFAIIALAHGAGNGFTFKPIFDKSNFSMSFVMAAVSLAVMSFLGFDGISTLAEEAKEGPKSVGRASLYALILISVVFIVQTYVTALVWPDYNSFQNTDSAFYEIAYKVGGGFLKVVTSLTSVLAFGIACGITTQSSSSRVLFAMARDKTLPSPLAKVHKKFKTPYVAILFVCVVSIVLSVGFANSMDTIANFVNFGALTAFLVLNFSVINYFIIRKKSKQYVKYLVLPIIGFIIIGYVWLSLDHLALIVGACWLVLGAIYFFVLKLMHRNASIDESVL